MGELFSGYPNAFSRFNINKLLKFDSAPTAEFRIMTHSGIVRIIRRIALSGALALPTGAFVTVMS